MPRGKYKRKSPVERFWEKVDVCGDNCWNWLACKRFGYGYLTVKYKKIQAHRLSWEYHYGPIPKDKFVLHKCDNKGCVNPSHLFLGTQKDNIRDMLKKNRQNYLRGVELPQTKLTPTQVVEIRGKYTPRQYTYDKLAKEYGVSYTQVYRIVNKERWEYIQ